MLGPKDWQTPNAIDPGEAPPSRPVRLIAQQQDEETTATTTSTSSDEIHQHAERLLAMAEKAHHDDDDDGIETSSVQLPSVEEARLYAERILHASGGSGKDINDDDDDEERQHLAKKPLSEAKAMEIEQNRQNSRRRAMLWLILFLIVVASGLITRIVLFAMDGRK